MKKTRNMVITSYYDQENYTDKVWYNSSNVVYSEFIENSEKNEGDLYVTFKNGATYKYKNVALTPDYLMFKNGGLDGSQGKALNTFIKKKYEFEKVEDKNLNQLEQNKNKYILLEREKILEKTYFISGHGKVTNEQFEKYKSTIQKVLKQHPDATFIVGDYQGVDILSQHYLIDELNINPLQIIVYHMFDKPRNCHPLITRLVGGFKTDEERDNAMTENSKQDIAFVNDHTKLSGTAQNILRRNRF